LPHHGAAISWLVIMTIQTAAVCAAGVVMAKIIEFPVISLRDRLFPARSGALLTP
jgi:hypothetical protein